MRGFLKTVSSKRLTGHELKYPNQNILYVRILEDVYAVPFIEEENGCIFLKKLFPSRKARKQLLGK
jgi:hypothetical protein